MGKKTWSAADDAELRRLYRALAPKRRLGEIPALTGRTESSICHRASRLGIADPRHSRRSGEENARWRGGRQAANKRALAKQAAERRARGAKQQQPWTEEEDNFLRSHSNTLAVKTIADELQRSYGSVKGRIQRLGLQGLGQGQGQRRGPLSPNWKGGKVAADRRAKYRVDVNVDDLLASQDGLCAICLKTSTTKRRWHIDHDHGTGRIRGILCHHCNLLLGQAKDSIQTLQRAVEYLRRHANPVT